MTMLMFVKQNNRSNGALLLMIIMVIALLGIVSTVCATCVSSSGSSEGVELRQEAKYDSMTLEMFRRELGLSSSPSNVLYFAISNVLLNQQNPEQGFFLTGDADGVYCHGK